MHMLESRAPAPAFFAHSAPEKNSVNPVQPAFTIFIPTYNRAYILPQALDSIAEQTFRDFEVLIMDDGSTDDTATVVADWSKRSGIPVRYYRHENCGTQRTHNRALQLAEGRLFVYLDSDNMLLPDTLERLHGHWESIPENERKGFAGIEGLYAYKDGRIEGTRFPQDVWDAGYVQMRREARITGDKGGAFLTEVIRQFPYPEIEGERHVRPSLVWKRMAREYRFRYVNEIMQIIDRQPDGKTANRFRLRMRNPKGFRLYYREDIDLHGASASRDALRKSAAEYVRYSLHSGAGPWRMVKDIEHKGLCLLAMPRGIAKWLGDRLRMWRNPV